mgnify:CR=1 FL=1
MSIWTRALLPEVEQAFKKRRLPAEWSAPDDWPRGLSWQALTELAWHGHPALLADMAPEAFCYFLPSVMVVSDLIAPRRLEAAAQLIDILAASAIEPQDFLVQRFRLLTPEERATISVWLARLSRHSSYRPDKILEAFQTMIWSTGLSPFKGLKS